MKNKNKLFHPDFYGDKDVLNMSDGTYESRLSKLVKEVYQERCKYKESIRTRYANKSVNSDYYGTLKIGDDVNVLLLMM